MKELLSRNVRRIGEAFDAFAWEDIECYAEFLAQTYYQVRHSTRLLACAAARFPQDAAGNAMHLRFAAHMAEEKSHEKLALHDLKQLGRDIAFYSELPSTRQFYEPQYYKIEHVTPLALFGYILPLESIGPEFGGRIAERIAIAHGSAALSFLKVHSSEDAGHLDKAFAMLESACAGDRLAIAENIEQTTYAYLGMIEGIQRASSRSWTSMPSSSARVRPA